MHSALGKVSMPSEQVFFCIVVKDWRRSHKILWHDGIITVGGSYYISNFLTQHKTVLFFQQATKSNTKRSINKALIVNVLDIWNATLLATWKFYRESKHATNLSTSLAHQAHSIPMLPSNGCKFPACFWSVWTIHSEIDWPVPCVEAPKFRTLYQRSWF